MRYLLKVSLVKSIDKWDNENGAEGKGRDIDYKQNSEESPNPPTKEDVQRLLDSMDYSILFDKCDLFEPGRYDYCCLEDDDGMRDENGNWIADYTINTEVSKLERLEGYSF
jgi:hypothetical protein